MLLKTISCARFKNSFLALAAALMIFLSGCAKKDDTDALPTLLKIGILPDESKTVLLKRYTPLFEHLSSELGIPYELKIPANYEALNDLFNDGAVDLAYFGGYTFIRAHRTSNAVPLVMRDIDTRFTSYFFSRVDITAKGITDYKGKRFSFGSRFSTSGHLMPRFFLQEKKIVPESFFSEVRYSGSHDETTKLVNDGIVDIGVANSKIIDTMIVDGRLSEDKIQILWETPPYPDYVWAVQPTISESVRTRLRDAFLSLSPANKAHSVILTGVDAGGFLPASSDDFTMLEKISDQMNLGGNNTEQ